MVAITSALKLSAEEPTLAYFRFAVRTTPVPATSTAAVASFTTSPFALPEFAPVPPARLSDIITT